MSRAALLCFPLVAFATIFGLEPVHAQICQGIPIEPGDHEIGGFMEAYGNNKLLALRYAGSSRAFGWQAYLGGVTDDFPGGIPGDLQPVVGVGGSWVGGAAGTCPVASVRFSDLDPGSFSMEPGDSDRSETLVVLGYGAGFSMPPDSTRPLTASVYVLPQVRWEREAVKHGADRSVETERRFEFETGAVLAGRRVWAGAAVRFFHHEFSDIPIEGAWLLRGGLRL